MNRKRRVIVGRADVAPNKARWTQRLVRLLGTMSDGAVARRAGVSLTAVRSERQRRGIPAFGAKRAPIRWTARMVAFLGTASDADVAAALHLPQDSVGYKRRALGIPPWKESAQAPDPFWTPQRVALLGTASDAEIASRLGVLPGKVAYQRKLRGIRAFRREPIPFRWTASCARLLGTDSDRRLAEKLGINTERVRRERARRNIPPFVCRMKVLPTPALRRILHLPMREVVARTGLNRKTVDRLRKELGVVPPDRVSPWTPEILRDLGRVSDAVIAARIGRSRRTVKRKRLALGRRLPTRKPWTAKEDALVRTTTIKDAAARTGRTAEAVMHRRRRLKRETAY